MTNATTRFWQDVSAAEFDRKTEQSGRTDAIRRIAQLAVPSLGHTRVSVDLGCGTGLLASVTGDRRIVGVDFSAPFLAVARQRMDTVVLASIFDLQFQPASLHNLFCLFVLDDYPADQKVAILRRVPCWLKPQAYFYLAAYSPRDERMEPLRAQINQQLRQDFTIFLEEQPFYEQQLSDCGLLVRTSEVLNATGTYHSQAGALAVTREFILITAQKLP